MIATYFEQHEAGKKHECYCTLAGVGELHLLGRIAVPGVVVVLAVFRSPQPVDLAILLEVLRPFFRSSPANRISGTAVQLRRREIRLTGRTAEIVYGSDGSTGGGWGLPLWFAG